VCTISQNPGATSKSSVPEDDIKQITYQGLKKISRQHIKFSHASNVAPGVCAPLWLYNQHNCPVYLLFLGQLNGMMCHRTTREMLTFCSRFMPRVFAQIKPIHQMRRKRPCGPSSCQGGPPHEQESKICRCFRTGFRSSLSYDKILTGSL